MDSYEQMKRMRQVSDDLKRFKFAETSDEAVRQAQEMIQGKRSEGDIFVTRSEMENQKKEEKKMQSSVAIENLREMVGKKLNVMTNDIDAIKNKINEIIEVINVLEDKMETHTNNSNGNSKPKEEQQTLSLDKEENIEDKKSVQDKPAQIVPERKETQPSSRSGDYKSEDVSIDKVFYFGKK